MSSQTGKKGGSVVTNGNFYPTPFCQIPYLQACSSDIADTIAKEGSFGGLAGSGWARTSGWGKVNL
eukprot:1144125-Pelagomonas_calceolata.AAC.8